jgi:hypothetical protein
LISLATARGTDQEAQLNRITKITCILLLITTPLIATAAQSLQTQKTSHEQSSSERAQVINLSLQRITSVLDQVLEAQKGFADENLRVMIQAHVADMLWSYDQPRARRLFEDSLQVSERLADQGAPPPVVGVASFYPVRIQVIRLIMPHDSDWAIRLVESRGDIVSDIKLRTGKNWERTQLQFQLCVHFAQRDPQRAALAVKPFVENGDLNFLMTLLGMIRFKDARTADELFLQALAKARLNQPSFEDIRRFATYVFPSFGEGVLRFSSNGGKSDPFAPSPSGAAAVQQFLEFSYEVATRRLQAAMTGEIGARLDPHSMLDFSIPKLLLPYFDRFIPDRAPAFRARLQEAVRRVPPEDRQYLVLTEPGTTEELLSRADAINDPRLKDTLIHRAIIQASNTDFERAASLIEKLSNEGGRLNARNSLIQRINDKRLNDAWSALNKGDYDTAEALAAEISDWRSDGLLVRSLVGQLARKDKLRAARILDGYERRAADIDEAHERALRLMQLAGVASSIDLNRGFEQMKLAIVEFNQAGFVPELERYRDNGAVTATGSTAAKVNVGLSGLLGNWDLYWMGSTDLNRALAITRQFQMKEAAALMQLNACRGALRAVPASAR